MAKTASFESKLSAVVRTALRPGYASSDRVEFKYSGKHIICLINGHGSQGATPSAALDAAMASWNRMLAAPTQTKKRRKVGATAKRTSRRSR